MITRTHKVVGGIGQLFNKLPSKNFMPVLVMFVVAILATACGGGDFGQTQGLGEGGSERDDNFAEEVRTADLSGVIEIDGSSTTFPITEAVAEEFHKKNPDVQVNVGISGTGGGFKRFIAKEIAIANSSRPITLAEHDAARANGIEYFDLRVAMDGLSVVVNPANDFVDCLTVQELKAIWEPGSTINNWSQVRSDFPDQSLRLYGPGTDSGTFDHFTKEIVGEMQAARADFVASEDDNVLVVGVSGDKNALGFFGYAYYAENADKLKVLGIDNGEGCVTPNPETIRSGDYEPLSRALYIYLSREHLYRPEVYAFLEFYLTNAGELVTEVGYVSMSKEEYGRHGNLIWSYTFGPRANTKYTKSAAR